MKRRLSIFFYKLYLYCKDDLIHDVLIFLNYFNLVKEIRYIRRRLENLRYFLPIIWKDYWFDSYYLYILIRAKLIQMESKFRSSGMTLESKKCADEMKLVIDDLTRMINEDIETEEYELFYNKYPRNKIKFGKHWIRNLNRHNNLRSEDEHLYFTEMLDRIYKRQEELRFKVFNTIATQSPNWWD